METLNPLLVILRRFLEKDHILSEECLKLVKESDGNLTVPVEMAYCENCGVGLINWLQLGEYQCPPRDHRNPLLAYEHTNKGSTGYNR